MIRQYIKQGLVLIKQNRFYTAVYVLGTGLAITMVMIMAIVYHIRTANIAPESNRDRMLIVNSGFARKENSRVGGLLSSRTVKECFYSLETAELVTAATGIDLPAYVGDFYLSTSGSLDRYKSYVRCTDANFFKVFNYSFIVGKPFTEEEFQSGIKTAVITESLARNLFKETNVQGRSILINDNEYRVSGVVKDVSNIMNYTEGDVWIPYSAIPTVRDYSTFNEIVGILHAYILAEKPSDFNMIKEEIEQKRQTYNLSFDEWKYEIRDDHILSNMHSVLEQMDYRVDIKTQMWRYGWIAFLFLLIPAINLSGLMSSRMQERIVELGIRKAFGANRMTLVSQVLTENFLLTLIGGFFGLIASSMIVFGLRNLLFAVAFKDFVEMNISFSMLFNLPVFLYAFGFCMILNVLSSIIPVWATTRRSIVQSLYDK